MKMIRCLIGALAGIALVSVAHAQDKSNFPDKSVRLVVPSSAGGPVYTVARILAEGLDAVWPHPVIVETKPGAGNSTGSIYVAKAAPDGYTLLIISGSVAVNPSLYPNLDKDPLKQFEPVSILVTAPQLLVARSDLKASNLKEYIDTGKSGSTPLNVASAGTGTISHLTQVLLEQQTGMKSSHIPFRGAAPAVTALLGGHVDAAWVMPAPTLTHIVSGKLKPIAVTGAARDPKLPQVPTADESGVPNFQVVNWQGLFAPAGTPKAVVDQISSVVAKVLHSPKVRARLASLGFEAQGEGPAAAAKLVRDDVARWSEVLAKSGIKLSK
jgi:tripartite-type tricarboxylate transporter receptor subunit TctC